MGGGKEKNKSGGRGSTRQGHEEEVKGEDEGCVI